MIVFVILVCIVLSFTILIALYLDHITSNNYYDVNPNLTDDVSILFQEKE